jgi:hypothetical protein
MSTTLDTRSTSNRSLAPLAAATCAVAAAGTAYGAHDWTELLVVTAVIAVAGLGVFGVVVPRALRRDSAGGTALWLSVPALLLTLPAFWSGLPLVLGVGGVVIGNAGRRGHAGAGRSAVAVALGALAILGYLTIYVVDGVVGGNAGFLFD